MFFVEQLLTSEYIERVGSVDLWCGDPELTINRRYSEARPVIPISAEGSHTKENEIHK